MDIANSIGSLLGGALSGGGIGSIANASTELLKLINNLTKDDPVKNMNAIRAFRNELLKLIKEVQGASEGQDVSDVVSTLTELLNK